MTHFKHICTGAEFGTYTGCAAVTTPQGRLADIDACLVPEIVSLWAEGIRTLESCCGHGRISGYIAVPDEHIEQMRGLGYVDEEGHLGCFYPKTNVHSERIAEQVAARYAALRHALINVDPKGNRGPIEMAIKNLVRQVHAERGGADPTEAEFNAVIDVAMSTQAATERP